MRLLRLVFLCLLLCVGLFSVAYGDEGGYTDTETHWCSGVISEWTRYRIVSGYGNGRFGPNDNIRRADCAMMLNNLFGLKDKGLNRFHDLPDNAYYTDAVLKLCAAGAFDAEGDSVRPLTYATREELFVALCKLLQLSPIEDVALPFSDAAAVSAPYLGYINRMYVSGYIAGYNNKLSPKSPITRAEALQVLDKVLDSVYYESRSYRDQTLESVFVKVDMVSFTKSEITRDMWVANSVEGNVVLTDTIVRGSLCLLGPTMLRLDGSTSVAQLSVFAPASLTGVAAVKDLYVSYAARGTTLDGIPKSLHLSVGSSVTIKPDFVLENTSYDAKSYTFAEIEKLVDEYKNPKSFIPTITVGSLALDAANRVSADRINIANVGSSAIVEVGLLWDKSGKTPTYTSYDGKELYTETQRFVPDMTIRRSDFQPSHSEWAYCVYAKNADGYIGYTPVALLSSYEFSSSTSIRYVSDGKDALVFEVIVEIVGDNIPEHTPYAMYGYDSSRSSAKSYALQLDPDIIQTNHHKVYKSQIAVPKVNGVFDKYTYYGYKIQFRTSVVEPLLNVFTQYPYPYGMIATAIEKDVTGGSSTTPPPAESTYAVKTGEGGVGAIKGSLLVSNSSVSASAWDSSEVLATGVYFLRSSKKDLVVTKYDSSAAWVAVYAYSGIGSPLSTFSVTLDSAANTADTIYYYVAFVTTRSGTKVGDIKVYDPLSVPLVIGQPLVTIEGMYAYLDYIVECEPNNRVILTEPHSVAVDAYTVDGTASLELTRVVASTGYLDSNKIRLVLTSMKMGSSYSFTVRFVNSIGASDKVTTTFTVTSEGKLNENEAHKP